MRILFIGDTHGDASVLGIATKFAKFSECSLIVQAGDFGFGFHTNSSGEDEFLRAVSNEAVASEIPWAFIDGNHDAHERLWSIYSSGGPEEVSKFPGVTYLPRGSVWEPQRGLRIGALGGAVSMDKRYRQEEISWWATEAITYGQVRQTVANWNAKRPQIIVTHDAPTVFPVLRNEELYDPRANSNPMLAESHANRNLLQVVGDAIDYTPHLWVHGHYHQRYTREFPRGMTAVGCDRFDGYDGLPSKHGTYVFDTDNLL